MSDKNEAAVDVEMFAILDGPSDCTCSFLDGCDCGMPVFSEVVRGGRRLQGGRSGAGDPS
jgi:hypothetical protein